MRPTAASHAIDAAPLDLPPNWRVDATLRADLPPHIDHRPYKRVADAPRYAVRVDGGTPAVFDLHRQCALQIEMAGRAKNRPRVRLVWGGVETIKGERGTTTIKKMFVSVLVSRAVYGPPEGRREAHHDDQDPTNNHWRNLTFLTPKENRAIEKRRPGYTARVEHLKSVPQDGERNRNCELPFAKLKELFKAWDSGRTTGKDLAHRFGISPAQVSKILNGKSRPLESCKACALIGMTPPRKVNEAAARLLEKN